MVCEHFLLVCGPSFHPTGRVLENNADSTLVGQSVLQMPIRARGWASWQVLPYPRWLSSSCSVSHREGAAEVHKRNCGLVHFSLHFLPLFTSLILQLDGLVRTHWGLLCLHGASLCYQYVVGRSLKSVLSEINTATPALPSFMCVMYLFFYSFTFNLPILIHLKCFL